jgi:peptidoglycan/LPS O-acetylase OafA/YrhL
MSTEKTRFHYNWVDGLKAFAIIAILLNHFVESFGKYPWFSFPSYNWPDFSTRISSFFPSEGPIIWRIVQFLGWLGDMGPGVFILLSGFTLTLSAFRKNQKEINVKSFYRNRLVRIVPLYLVIHILVMVSGVFFGKGHIDFTSGHVFLSMLGLRFTDGLFFFINPSWWFVWLIIQLYFVFPFLYKYMIKTDIKTFLLVTFGFTVLSRAAGLLNVTYSSNLEYWMMGIFFGTRLSEFAIGMALAKLFIEKQINPANLSVSRLLPLSAVLYIIGFICSLFYATTLISSTFITVGLCGLFLVLWKAIESHLLLLKPIVKWIGLASFPVFLIHQPFMVWSGADHNGIEKALILFFVVLLAFPAGWFLEWIVNQILRVLPVIKKEIVFLVIIISLFLQIFLNILFFFFHYNSYYQLDVLFFIVNIFFISLYVLLGNKIRNKTLETILYVFLPTSAIFCFILTTNWFNIFWMFILAYLLLFFFISLFTKKLIIREVLPFFLVFILILSAEYYLLRNHPVETIRWGEYPALQKDPVTVYSLIPNKKTHLKYNNYDYIVKTNSFGFNGPDFDLSYKDSMEYRILIIGDAFTMPEGMEYEKAYPELLQTYLSERYPTKKIKVINAAVTGYGPNEMYAQLSKYIDTLKPDLYINQMFINEFEEIDLDSTARLSSLKFSKLSFRNELFSGNQIPFQVSFTIHKLLNDSDYLNYTYYKSLAYFYEKKSYLFTGKNISKLNNYFLNVKSLCKSKNCKVAVLFAPGQLEISVPTDIDYYPYHSSLSDTSKYDLDLPKNIMKKLSNDKDILFLDPTKQLKSNQLQPVYFRGSWHWNSEGHKVIAAFLGQEIPKIIELK